MLGSYETGVDRYRKTSVNTASPLELVVMLYDGALRFIDAGKQAMLQKQLDTQNVNITKAQKIISELMSCLDMRQGGEVAANLFALYNYSLNLLIEANVQDRPELLDQARWILSNLRESWVELQNQQLSQSASDAPINSSRLQLEG